MALQATADHTFIDWDEDTSTGIPGAMGHDPHGMKALEFGYLDGIPYSQIFGEYTGPPTPGQVCMLIIGIESDDLFTLRLRDFKARCQHSGWFVEVQWLQDPDLAANWNLVKRRLDGFKAKYSGHPMVVSVNGHGNVWAGRIWLGTDRINNRQEVDYLDTAVVIQTLEEWTDEKILVLVYTCFAAVIVKCSKRLQEPGNDECNGSGCLHVVSACREKEKVKSPYCRYWPCCPEECDHDSGHDHFLRRVDAVLRMLSPFNPRLTTSELFLGLEASYKAFPEESLRVQIGRMSLHK